MADSQKLILMIEPIRLQGLIWQAVLKSQKISVIWEAPTTNLMDNLDQLQQAGLALPDLLLIDVQAEGLQPYSFCRWCREHHPKVKMLLVNGGQSDISSAERQWAINQGAIDLLPGFQQENLVTSVTAGVKRLLESLGDQTLDNGSLISVLLTMKRELDKRRSAAEGRRPSSPEALKLTNGNGTALQDQPPSPTTSVANNNPKPAAKSSPAKQGRGGNYELTAEQLEALQREAEKQAEEEAAKPHRRYRGRTY